MVRKLGRPFPMPGNWGRIGPDCVAFSMPVGMLVTWRNREGRELADMTKIVFRTRSAQGEFTECFYFEECPVSKDRLESLSESLNNRFGVTSQLLTDAYGKALETADG